MFAAPFNQGKPQGWLVSVLTTNVFFAAITALFSRSAVNLPLDIPSRRLLTSAPENALWTEKNQMKLIHKMWSISIKLFITKLAITVIYFKCDIHKMYYSFNISILRKLKKKQEKLIVLSQYYITMIVRQTKNKYMQMKNH
jgi:hypothetical protein